MWLNILMIVAGVALVLWGADRLTDGAVALAERMNIPQIVIGLTIVALGTSAPEFCVSIVSALKGTADLAVGNVVGSNIFNTMLIVGVTAMVAPMTILPSTVKKDIPITLISSVVLTAMVMMDDYLSRLDAALLFIGMIVFMWFTLRNAKGDMEQEQVASRGYSVPKALVLLVLGLGCLVIGSNIFVDGATNVAQMLGVSEAVIGLTIVAGGTSLPELATSVVAARKGNSGIAIGNVLGSNVMNILLILGGAGLISPMHVQGITIVDFAVMTLSMLLLWLFSYTKLTIARWEGAVLTTLFLGYMTWLVVGVI
ncbi:MAG: calcium/sodium antiporter [Paludibacteraceae bacterium]|nr:calcium/sodium antiporter [Paludibacteraceae bacterium]